MMKEIKDREEDQKKQINMEREEIER